MSRIFHATARFMAKPPDDPFHDWSVTMEDGSRARPSVDIDFIGTICHEKEDPFAMPEKKRQRKAALERQARHNKDVLSRAVFILSQSPTGRDLLENMTKNGYRVVFDDRRTGDRGAGGLCDPGDKMIILRGHDNPAYLALLIGHEATHALQSMQSDLFPSSRHRPEVGIQLSFAIEADAYAQQSQIALELAHGDPAGPPDQLKMQEPLLQMRARFPDIVGAAERVLKDETALHDGSSVAAAFEAFYDNFHLRTFYEDAHMEWSFSYAPRVQRGFSWLQKSFNRAADSKQIKDRIRHRGRDYLNRHAPHLTFDDARHSGVTDVTDGKIRDFYARYLPGQAVPPLKSFGVHMKDAVSWVLGLTSKIHVVLKPGDDPTRPPLRPPPQRRWGSWK